MVRRYGEGSSDEELAMGLAQLKEQKKRERFRRRTSIYLGAFLLALWILVGSAGYWGAGLILAPTGGFILVWGVVMEILAFGSHNT